MLDHLGIQCADVAAAKAFYDAALDPLGAKVLMSPADGVHGYGVDFPHFWLGPLTTGEPNRGLHVAFTAPSRAAVDAFLAAAVAAGAEVLHQARVWPEYHPGYYGAFVRDPDGNNVEAVCHTPE